MQDRLYLYGNHQPRLKRRFMYHKVSVFLNEVPEEFVQIQPILNRCRNAEQFAKNHVHDAKFTIALANLDKSVILLVMYTDEWVENAFLQDHVQTFMQSLLEFEGKFPLKTEEILASEAHYLLRDRPLDCGEIPFPTSNVKSALENNPIDGVHIEEQYFDLDIPQNRIWDRPKILENDDDLFNEILRIREAPVVQLARCFPVHYALSAGYLEEAETAASFLISALLEYQRLKSRRIIQITIKLGNVNLRRMDAILDSAKDSACIFRFDSNFDTNTSDVQEQMIEIAKHLYPYFQVNQFFFFIEEGQSEIFDTLRNLFVAIPILDLDVDLKTSYKDERSIVSAWLGYAGISQNDLEERYYSVTNSGYSNPKVDFQKIYCSHILNAVYPQYSTLFPELRIKGLKSNVSYAELKRLFPLDEVDGDVKALIDLQYHLDLKIPTLPPKTRNQFAYAVVGERGMGHDSLIHHHSAILHDMGYIEDQHIVTMDMFDLIAESRRSSVVAFLDKFEEAAGGVMVIDLNGPKDENSDLDPIFPFLSLLINHELNFALYIKVNSHEWEELLLLYPSISFVIHQVFQLEPLRSLDAVSFFRYDMEKLHIQVDSTAIDMLEKWIREQQDSPYYLHRITLRDLVFHVRLFRNKWAFQRKLSAETRDKEFILDQETMRTLLWEFAQDLKFNFERTDDIYA